MNPTSAIKSNYLVKLIFLCTFNLLVDTTHAQSQVSVEKKDVQDTILPVELNLRLIQAANTLHEKFPLKRHDKLSAESDSIKQMILALSFFLQKYKFPQDYLKFLNNDAVLIEQISESQDSSLFPVVYELKKDLSVKLKSLERRMRLSNNAEENFVQGFPVIIHTQELTKNKLIGLSNCVIRANGPGNKNFEKPDFRFDDKLTNPNLEVVMYEGYYKIWAEPFDHPENKFPKNKINYTISHQFQNKKQKIELTLLPNE